MRTYFCPLFAVISFCAACITVRTGPPPATETPSSTAAAQPSATDEKPSDGRAAAAPPAAEPAHPEFDRPAEDLERAIGDATKGFAKLGPERRGRLEDFKTISFPGVRGRCYLAVLRLGKGASFSDNARSGGIDFAFFQNGENIGGDASGVIGPGGASSHCPLKSGGLVFDLRANWGSAVDPSHVHDLGQGDYVIQIYSKAIPAAEVAKQEASLHKADAEADEAMRRREADACRRCTKERADCLEGATARPAGRSCQDVFDDCFARSAASPKNCR